MIGIYIWIIYCLLSQLVWTLMRQFYGLCQKIMWKVDGTSSQIQKNHQRHSYKGTVQVMKVLTRFKYDPLGQPSGPSNFLASHKSFQDPEYVLEDHVSLYYVNKNEAIWVEVEKGIDPAKSDYSSFYRFAQWKLARKLIIMPIHIFKQLGSKVGKPSGKIVLLSNTARCGSTLVTRVFSETDTCLAFSEPDSMDAMSQLRGRVSDKERADIFKNSINLLCKPLHSRKIEAYIIKLTQPTMVEIPHIKELLPDSYHVFLYRDGLPVARSLAKIANNVPILAIMQIVGHWSGSFTKRMIAELGLYADNFEQKLHSELQYGVIMWAAGMRQYRDFKEQDIDIVAAKYEDIVIDPILAFQKVFDYCNIPFDAKAVERGMGEDSQHHSPISHEQMKRYKPAAFTDEVKLISDKICDHFRVARLPETFVASGTITSQQ